MQEKMERVVEGFCKVHELRVIPVSFAPLKRANGLYRWRGDSPERSEIILSSGIKQHYGFSRVIATLMHELTHYYCHVKFGTTEHDETFKKYCAMFGGTMNSEMAGEEYKEAASSAYVSSAVEFRLRCECGRCRSQVYLKLPSLTFRRNRFCGSCMQTMDKWERVKV